MSLERLKHLKEFLDNTYGSSWHKVNLHVHASGQDPKEIVDEAIKTGISLISITDHNTFRFVEPVQKEAKIRGDNLVVLPGIEISLEEGPHILAIFDSDFNKTKQMCFCSKLDLPPVNGTPNDSVKKKTCNEVLRDITDAKGITVVPHPYSNNIGFLDSARKFTIRMSWLESGNIGLIQISDDKVKYIDYDDKRKWQNRYILKSTSPREIPLTNYCLSPISTGEAKKPSEIEKGTTWLKLGSRTVQALKQITCEPKTCISRKKPLEQKKCKLLGLTVRGGFFDGLKIGFSPDFTCIFGENHSGKSAIFDFISFSLGQDLSVLSMNRNEELKLLLNRLNAILQSDSEVNLYLIQDRQAFCIFRKFKPEYDQHSNIVGCQNNLEAFKYNPSNDELVPIEPKEAIFLPEIYSQGYVGILRKSVQSQLSLIDELAGLLELCIKREGLKNKLKENAEELADLYDRKENLTGLVGKLPDLNSQLINNTKHLEETDYQLWKNTKSIIDEVNTRITNLDENIIDEDNLKNSFLITVTKFNEKKVKHPDLLNSISGIIDAYNQLINSAISQTIKAFKSLKDEFSIILSKWDAKYNIHKIKVTEMLRQKGFESPEKLLKTIEILQHDIDEINKSHSPELNHINSKIESLNTSRETLLKELKGIFSTIAQIRQEKIDELNQFIKPDIKINLEESNKESFFELLKEIYTYIASQDRRLKNIDEQLSLIINKISPSQLIEAISNDGKFSQSNGTISTLCETCAITQNTQDVLCTIKGAIKSLHKLQIFDLEPVPKISVRREGTNVFADLSTELSPGEQSSAILTLALISRNVPLMIDQPEDELGYNYIVNKIVLKILEAKKERQIILISHNANIPVLADAEYLIKVRNDPEESQSNCKVEISGTFAETDICNKILELEGGKRAFQIRQYRYSIPHSVKSD